MVIYLRRHLCSPKILCPKETSDATARGPYFGSFGVFSVLIAPKGGQMRQEQEFRRAVFFPSPAGMSLRHIAAERFWNGRFFFAVASFLVVLCTAIQVQAANRSTYILYDSPWVGPSEFRYIAFDQIHQQIFAAWPMLDRIDVLSAADYHLIQSIPALSPLSLDISPDGTTLAVGTSSSHILFFDTSTLAKTNDVVFPVSALGISAFVYTANGNAMVRAEAGLSTGGGITAYWDHVANAFINQSNVVGVMGPYQSEGPMTRSGDYSRIMLGDSTTAGVVQIIDGNTGQVVQKLSYFGVYVTWLAANKDASRYALCLASPGFAATLAILDSSFDVIYQDQGGCIGMTFSADGETLYRDGSANGVSGTQSIDMKTFSIRNTTNNFSSQSGYATQWQGADSTGMVYGMNPNNSSGTIFQAVDTTTTSTPAVPTLNDPVHIVRVIDNIGSPQGGDLIRLLCTGVDTVSAGSVSVTIGGASTTNLAVEPLGSLTQYFPSLPNLRLVEVKTSPSTPGLADVTLHVNGATDTAVKAFQFAQSSKVFPFSTSPNFLLYDSSRQKLYASHKDQVEVIDPLAQKVLTPLVPASGKLQNSQFGGLSLSPDGNRLYIADAGANLIHILDLSSSGTGTSVNPGAAMGSSSPISPGRVFETTSGKLVGSDVGGAMFMIDRLSGIGTSLRDEFGNKVAGFAWSSTNKGRNIFISTGTCGNGLNANGLISDCLGLWDDAASQYTSSRDLTQWIEEAGANEDGTVIIAGGSTPGIVDLFPEIVDFNLNTMGLIRNHFDIPMPQGTPSFFLHPSGALLYKAGYELLSGGITPFGGRVEIDDVHQFQPAATVAFPEPFITSYSPYTDHMLTTDDAGRYFFGVTESGISMMRLNATPLSIGNLQPAFGQPASGQTVTIRGSGFQSGAVASVGGVQTSTTFVDEDTLMATVPALSLGFQDVTVTNVNGNSYTIQGGFQVLGPSLTPSITGFSPVELIAATDDPALTSTVLGTGFAAYDTVEINGQPTDSVFLDVSHMKAAIPAGLTRQTGSVPVTVVSPYTGSSNTLSIPIVNPPPIVHYTLPEVLVTGSSTTNLNVYGTGFVAESVVQWNGQDLSTTLNGGETSVGDKLVIASVPGSLLANGGTATIKVFNPAPGGGVSNAFSEKVSSPQPVVSFPASIDFGKVLLNTTGTQTVQLTNLGSATYTINSATMNSNSFSTQAKSCVGISIVNICNLQVQFSPTTAGTAMTTLTITDNAAGSPHSIPVTGTGTQTLVPVPTLTFIDSLGRTVSATLYGNATVGGAAVPAIAWIEYGTDPLLATFTQTVPWTFAGDSNVSFSLTGLNPATTYSARLAVQTSGGTGKSIIRLFATIAAPPAIRLATALGGSNVATVSAGQTATFNLLASDGGNGYTGTATLSCSGIVTGATCIVTPSTVAIGLNSTPLTVTITTTAPSIASQKGAPSDLVVLAFGFLLGTGSLAFGMKRHSVNLLICVAVLTMFAFACGGSGSPSSTGGGPVPPPATTATPPGTYFFTINASTGGGVQTSQLLTLTVK
jgi:hypothetical protein